MSMPKCTKAKPACACRRECVIGRIEARKMLLQTCKLISLPCRPRLTARWQAHDTEQMVDDIRYFRFAKDAAWHDFDGYAENQYFIDPCKLSLTTPGINRDTGEYEATGISASVLAHLSARALADSRKSRPQFDFVFAHTSGKHGQIPAFGGHHRPL